MMQINAQIEAIEKEIRETPYHKATEHHIGKLRAKLSRLKAKQFESASRKKGGGVGYAVKKQGDATIVLVGPPSVGKSTLLNKLTNAKSKVAPYEFTTVTVIPGMMGYKDAKIQILDVPGLIEGAEEGKGRGREVLSVIRGSDLVLIMSDVEKVKSIEKIKDALYRNGIRINQNRPDVVIDKKLSGGIIIHSNIKQDLDKQTIKGVATELGIKNAEITLKEKLDMEQLVDAFSASRVYIPALFIINKSDLAKKELKASRGENCLYISAQESINLDKLREIVWKSLSLVRIYLVRPESDPDFDHPQIMKQGQTLQDAAIKISEEFAEDKTKARIWGNGAKFPGQEVSLSTKVQEGMQVRFI